MSSKMLAYIMLTLILLLGVGYLFSAYSLKSADESNTLSSGYFPQILGIALIILCIISIVQTVLKKEDEKIDRGNLLMTLSTLAVTSLFIIGWQTFGFFYIQLFIFLFVLFTIYRFKSLNKKIFFVNVIISLFVSGSIYLIFERLMHFYL